MKKILILGAGSFSAKHFYKILSSLHNWEIYGTLFRTSIKLPLKNCIELDITDGSSVEQVMMDIKPDYVINFSGWTVGEDAHVFYMVHCQGALNILLAARSMPRLPKILMIGAAAEYGSQSESNLPTKENAVTRPFSHYGRSKLMQTMLSSQAAQEWGIPVMIARPFNIIGPGMGVHLAPSFFLQQIRHVKEGLASGIKTGPLNSKRDYIDIRDAVEAYLRILQKGKPGEIYNICSGVSVTMSDLLKMMCKEAGLSDLHISSSEIGSNRSRTVDNSCGDYSKILKEFGWTPKYQLGESVRYLISDDF